MYKLHVTDAHFSTYQESANVGAASRTEFQALLFHKRLSLFSGLCRDNFNRSENHRMGSGGKRPQWVIQPKPPAQAGSS